MTLLAIATIFNSLGLIFLTRASILNSKSIQRIAAYLWGRPRD